jgi:protein-tyrosine phosphatase
VICAALLLLSLGAPEETVITDHNLSYKFVTSKSNVIRGHLESLGIDREEVTPLFSAPHYLINVILDYIHNNYGSANNYLRLRAGMNNQIFEKLRSELLD